MCIARWITVYGAGVDGFVTAAAENGGGKDLMGCGVDQHLHEHPRLARWTARPTFVIGRFPVSAGRAADDDAELVGAPCDVRGAGAGRQRASLQ